MQSGRIVVSYYFTRTVWPWPAGNGTTTVGLNSCMRTLSEAASPVPVTRGKAVPVDRRNMSVYRAYQHSFR